MHRCPRVTTSDLLSLRVYYLVEYANVSTPFPTDVSEDPFSCFHFCFDFCVCDRGNQFCQESIIRCNLITQPSKIQEHIIIFMEGLFLTIALSIAVPLLILLLWFFVIFIVVKRCILGKKLPSNNGDVALCGQNEYVAETTAISDCPDEPILHDQDVQDCQRSSFTEQVLQLPLYSTLPRNTSRVSSDVPREHPGVNTRHGFRLYPYNYSPFSQNTSMNRTETMQALSRYCDRYIADAYYDQPPPYSSRENFQEHPQMTSTMYEREVATYGCETWI